MLEIAEKGTKYCVILYINFMFRRRSRSRSNDRRRGGRDNYRRDRDNRRRSSRSRSDSRGRRDDYRSSRRYGGNRDRDRD